MSTSSDAENIKNEILENELKDTRKKLGEIAGSSRARACAMTKIDEAIHWLTADRESRTELRLNAIKEIANGRNDRY